MRFITKKRAMAAGAALLLAGGGMAAYAYWTGSGTGTGTANAGTPAALTVKQTSTINGLYPGGSAVTLSGNFDNPNSYGVYVANVTATIPAFSVRPDNTKPACTEADFQLGGTATVNANVPNGNGQGAWSGLTVKMLDNGLNQDNCKSVAVTISYTANGS